MNAAALLLIIAQDALSVLETTGVGGPGVVAGEKAGEVLISIVQKALAAYQQQTGQPLDPALIRPFEPIP